MSPLCLSPVTQDQSLGVADTPTHAHATAHAHVTLGRAGGHAPRGVPKGPDVTRTHAVLEAECATEVPKECVTA
jgi:hypothetical protein